MSSLPPPTVEPQTEPRSRATEGQRAIPGASKANTLKGKLGAIGAFFVAVGKFLLPAVKFLKGAKFLLTGISMLASIWFYSTQFGWPLAVLFVLGILVHEMGHVGTAAYLGLPVSAPLFIPGFGALITLKRNTKSAWESAFVGIGGPIAGATAGMIFWGTYLVTGSGLFLVAAFFTFLINLFNMIPLFPLDGGRIVGAVSPYLWLIGFAALIVGALKGYVPGFLLIILLIFSAPQIWSSLKRGTADPVGGLKTTKTQSIVMGLAYLALSGMLFGSMEFAATELQHLQKTSKSVAQPV